MKNSTLTDELTYLDNLKHKLFNKIKGSPVKRIKKCRPMREQIS
jgi:hypothetical protein